MGQPDSADAAKIGNGGWVRFSTTAVEHVDIYLRFTDTGGRLEPAEMFIEGALDTEVLRRVPLGRWEAWANSPDLADDIRHSMQYPGPDLSTAAAHFATSFGYRTNNSTGELEPVDHWVAQMLGSQVDGSGFEAVKRPRRVRDRVRASRGDLRVEVPGRGGDYGDDFYRRVAEVYGRAAAVDRGPALAIAAANDVEVSTVHRWVKEARRRGLLASGRVGKA